MQLIKYDAACRAIAEAKAVDEIRELRDKAEAMRQYARVSKNRQLEVDCAEIRIRAERRLGQMLLESNKNTGGRPSKKPLDSDEGFSPTLNDAGISYDLSSRAQTIATIPDDDFEQTMAEHRAEQKAVSARTMKKLTGAKPKPKLNPNVSALLQAWRSANCADRHVFLVEIGLATDRPALNVWDSYAVAYQARYGVEPVRNAKANSQLRQLVDRIGADAPHVASFYVRHNGSFYVQKAHPIGILLNDAEKLRTEWATDTTITQTHARQVDRKQSTVNAFGKLLGDSNG